MPDNDNNTMTTRDIQELRGYAHPHHASEWARRNGVQPLPSSGISHTWPRDQIWEIHNNSRHGVRTDLGYTSVGTAPSSLPRMTGDDWLILGYLASSPDATARAARANEEPDPAAGVAHRNRLIGMENRGLVRRRKPRAKDGKNSATTATITGLGRERWAERDAWGID